MAWPVEMSAATSTAVLLDRHTDTSSTLFGVPATKSYTLRRSPLNQRSSPANHRFSMTNACTGRSYGTYSVFSNRSSHCQTLDSPCVQPRQQLHTLTLRRSSSALLAPRRTSIPSTASQQTRHRESTREHSSRRGCQASCISSRRYLRVQKEVRSPIVFVEVWRGASVPT